MPFAFVLTEGNVRPSERPNSIFLLKDVVGHFPDNAVKGHSHECPFNVVLGDGVTFPTLICPKKKNVRSGRSASQKWLLDIGAKAGDLIEVTDMGHRTYKFEHISK